MIFVDILAMLALSAAAGCGLGGGGLLVVYLTLVKNADQVVAQALNLLFYILAATSSTLSQREKTSKTLIRAAVFCSAVALPGAYLGSVVRGSISDGLLRIFFGVFLIVAGITFGISSIKKLREEKKSAKKPVL
ncbi:MAG: sulfite exporter TauE/SafE family protein [Clostridia bacterium]|nr:sulfite exporter TauE/SafE family protein [Clostridia bacterium]